MGELASGNMVCDIRYDCYTRTEFSPYCMAVYCPTGDRNPITELPMEVERDECGYRHLYQKYCGDDAITHFSTETRVTYQDAPIDVNSHTVPIWIIFNTQEWNDKTNRRRTNDEPK